MIVDDLKASILNFAISGNFVKNSNNNASTELQTLYKIKEKQILNKEVLISAKIFPVKEVPFQVPSNWEWVRLGNISKVVSKGTTPQGGKNAYKESGIKFLRAENVKNYKIDETNIQFISEDVHQNFLRRSILEDKDLLICIAGTLGRCGIVSQENLPLNTNQAVSFVRMINTDLINVKYISYAISSPIIQNILIDQKKITAIPNLTLEIIANCLIPLPPLEEQNRIVDKLEKLFFKLDEVKPIEDELMEEKINFSKKIFKSVLNYIYKENEKVTKVKLESIINFENIKKSSKGKYVYLDVKYLRNKNEKKFLEEGSFINKGELALLMDGDNSGELFKIPEDGYLGSTLKKITIKPVIIEKYLIYYLKFKQDYFKGNKKGAAIPHLNKVLFNESEIYLPDINEQQKIVNRIEQLLPLLNDIELLVNG